MKNNYILLLGLSSIALAEAWVMLLTIFINYMHDIETCMICVVLLWILNVICGKEMMSKGHVAIHETSAYYADLAFCGSECHG